MIDIFNHPISFEDGRERHLTLGPVDLWIQWKAGEWSVAHKHDLTQENRPIAWNEESKPQDITSERWITAQKSSELMIKPLMPERPVVVRPESPVRLLPGLSTNFYVGIPLWFGLYIGKVKRASLLCEIPSIKLSNSWFGTPVKGDLCYSMRTRASISPDDLSKRMHRCVCNLQVRNISKDVLSFERICIQCQHLRIFAGDQRFWSNVIRMSYRGTDEWSRVVYSGNAPELSGATLSVAEPRKPISRGFLQNALWTPEG